jgi:predicted nuclease with TOPRIM domain
MKPQIPQISTALSILRPDSSWVLCGEELYENIDWKDKTQTKPTEEEVNEKVEELKIERQKTEYQRQRKPEYPSITDQLDALFHAGVFPEDMAAKIQEVKDKYPKPL